MGSNKINISLKWGKQLKCAGYFMQIGSVGPVSNLKMKSEKTSKLFVFIFLIKIYILTTYLRRPLMILNTTTFKYCTHNKTSQIYFARLSFIFDITIILLTRIPYKRRQIVTQTLWHHSFTVIHFARVGEKFRRIAQKIVKKKFVLTLNMTSECFLIEWMNENRREQGCAERERGKHITARNYGFCCHRIAFQMITENWIVRLIYIDIYVR